MKTLQNKKTILLFLLTFIMSSRGISQVSGYLGNRFSAGYHLGIGTDFNEFFESGTPCRGSFFNYRHDLVFNYVIGRRTMIGAEIGFSSMTFDNLSDPNVIAPDNSERSITTSDNATISYLSFGVNARFYGGQSTIAPIGYYFKMRTGILNSSLKLPAYIYIDNTDYNNPVVKSVLAESESYSSFYFGMGGGNTRILAGKVMLDMSIEINWVDPSTTLFPIGNQEQSLYSNTANSTIIRVAQASFITYSIGIEGLFGKKSVVN